MTSDAASWQDFRPDENCVPVGVESQVRLYFSQLTRALDALQRSVGRGAGITNAERSAVEEFLRRLRGTTEALALRHLFASPAEPLKLDATDSGFAHWSCLLELAADLEQRPARLAQLPGAEALKRQMLEQIVEYSLHPRELQLAMARRLYLETLAAETLLRAFVPGELTKVGGEDDEESHFWSFASYDRALSRPFLYLVYFAYEGGAKALREDYERVRAVAEATASGRVSLLAFSNRLDQQLPGLRPRIVKRLILGPYWSPHFTRNEGELGAVLERVAERLPFALRWETETLISERETRVGAGWLSKGQLRQVFWIPERIDLSARGASQLERFVLLPHWLAPHLKSAGLFEDHRFLAIDESGETHGVD